jgi:hypothetical protein
MNDDATTVADPTKPVSPAQPITPEMERYIAAMVGDAVRRATGPATTIENSVTDSDPFSGWDGQSGIDSIGLFAEAPMFEEAPAFTGWPGYLTVSNQMFYDPDIAPDDNRFRQGTIISGRGNGWEWLTINYSGTPGVTYSPQGWPSYPFPPNMDYLYVPHIQGVPPYPRTG